MEPQPSAQRMPSLLIVDDDVGFVHAAAEIARLQGFDITIAGELSQAIHRVRQRDFDLALVDLDLPDGNGLSLLQDVDTDRTRAIVVTGKPTVETALQSFRSAVVDYLIKPIDLPVLGRAIQNALRRRDTMLEGQQINQWLKEEVALRVAERRLEQAAQERISVATLEALVNALEAKDPHLRGHSARVADLSASVAAGSAT
jgi:DNA-binding NtrC family response regulator